MQKEAFLESEGDAWINRNRATLEHFSPETDLVFGVVKPYIQPGWSVAEVGCGLAHRLAALSQLTGGPGYGVDPSLQALNDASIRFPQLNLNRATADALPWQDGSVDLLVYGFCLYLCDRNDLFRIAAEGDRVLRSGGMLAILDFHPSHPYRTPYKHRPGLFTFKMEYARMWSWDPAYTLMSQKMFDHDTGSAQQLGNPDRRISVSVLVKAPSLAYPEHQIS